MIPMTQDPVSIFFLTMYYYAHALGKSARATGDMVACMYGDFSALFLHYRHTGYPYAIITRIHRCHQ
jgi:hypothetical protein